MASATQELDVFVREALLRGHDREEIGQALVAAGWSREQADSALAGYADVRFPIPVPRPRASLSAREAFLYLVMFSALYFTAYNLGSLLFKLLELALPDPADPTYRQLQLGHSMRWSIAAVIIAFPVFAWVSRLVGRELARQPIKRLSPVRRWLTYLTLFLASCILVGDLTTLVYNLLGGELSLRFVLKVLVVGAIAGSIFGYYLHDLRREETEA